MLMAQWTSVLLCCTAQISFMAHICRQQNFCQTCMPEQQFSLCVWLLCRLRKHEEVVRSFTLRTARAGATHGAVFIQLCSLRTSAGA